MTRLGLTSYAYHAACSAAAGPRRMRAEDLVARTAELGLTVLQLCENVALDRSDPRALAGLRARAEELGVTLELGTRGLDPDELVAELDVAAALGASLVRVVPWTGGERRNPGTAARLPVVLLGLLPEARRRGLAIAVENYFDITDEELLDAVRGIDDELVGVCLDTANSVGLLRDPLESARLLARYVLSVHLKDFEIRKPTIGYQVTGVPFGRGWLPADDVVDVVRRAGRDPNFLIELWVDPQETSAATIQLEDEWVRASVDFARTLLAPAAAAAI